MVSVICIKGFSTEKKQEARVDVLTEVPFLFGVYVCVWIELENE